MKKLKIPGVYKKLISFEAFIFSPEVFMYPSMASFLKFFKAESKDLCSENKFIKLKLFPASTPFLLRT